MEPWWANLIGLTALTLMLLAGGLLTVLQLPGTWFILLAGTLYAWYYDFDRISWTTLAVLAGIAVTAEIVELLAGAKGAQQFGASRRASWGALIGGFCGLLIFTPMIPILIVGSVLGGLIGCFAGAFIAEASMHGDHQRSTRAGVGAVLGRLAGLMIKIFASVAMAGLTIGSAIG